MKTILASLLAILAFIFCSSAIATLDTPPLLWQKTFGGPNDDIGRSVQQTVDGGYIIAGSTSSFGAGNRDVYLVKVGFEGCERWDFNCDRSVGFLRPRDFGVTLAGRKVKGIKVSEYQGAGYQDSRKSDDELISELVNGSTLLTIPSKVEGLD